MSSRDLVPYGGGRESTRDLVPYGTGRESTQHRRQSTRDSRSHRTTTRGHTSYDDPCPYDSGREATRHLWDPAYMDSRSHRTTTRGYTSHRDYSPSPSTSGSDRSPSRTVVRRDSRTHTNYAVTQREHGRRHHNPADEFSFSDDEEDLPMPFHGHGYGGYGSIRESPVGGHRQIAYGPGDESDWSSSDEGSRGYTNRSGSMRYPSTTGSSRHHTNTGSTRRSTMTSSRHTSHSTAGGYRSTYGESSRSSRR